MCVSLIDLGEGHNVQYVASVSKAKARVYVDKTTSDYTDASTWIIALHQYSIMVSIASQCIELFKH